MRYSKGIFEGDRSPLRQGFGVQGLKKLKKAPRELGGLFLFYLLNNRLKGIRIVHGQIGQRLPVYVDVFFVDLTHEH